MTEKLPNSTGCFVCGHSNPGGLAARFHIEGDRVRTRYTPAPAQMGYKGITHGGIIAALLDETMGWAPAIANRRFCVTVEMSIQYLKPIPIGHEVEVSAWVTDGRRRIWEAEGEIRDSDGNLYARGKGRFLPVSDEQTREVVSYLNFDEGCVGPERICRTCGPRESTASNTSTQ